ncbi:MAG: hypothetical protein ACP5PT_00950 [Brevinematia bacterium]|jgi:hypothetical protein
MLQQAINSIPRVKIKERESMSDGFVDFDIMFKSSVDKFVDYLDNT